MFMHVSHKTLPTLAMMLVALMVMNSSIYIPCLPYIRDEFFTRDSVMLFVVVINPLVAIFMNLFFGFLCDFYERKTLLMMSIICFMTGCIVCGFSFNIETFLLGRLFQATGDAGIAVLTLMILHNANEKTFSYHLGILSILFATIWILAPVLGAQILNWLGWRYNFYFIFFSVLFVSALLHWHLPKTLKAKKVLAPSSLRTLWYDFCSLLKTRSFSIPNWGGALAIGVFSTFETFSSFIYIDIFKFSPVKFSVIHGLIIFINGISSVLYICVIKTQAVRTSLISGIILYRFYVFGNFLLLLCIFPSSPILTSILITFLVSSLPFITSTSTIYALKDIKEQKELAVSIIFVSRNIASTTIPLIASLFYKRDISSFWMVSFIFSLVAIILLQKTRDLKASHHPHNIHHQTEVRKRRMRF